MPVVLWRSSPRLTMARLLPAWTSLRNAKLSLRTFWCRSSTIYAGVGLWNRGGALPEVTCSRNSRRRSVCGRSLRRWSPHSFKIRRWPVANPGNRCNRCGEMFQEGLCLSWMQSRWRPFILRVLHRIFLYEFRGFEGETMKTGW